MSTAAAARGGAASPAPPPVPAITVYQPYAWGIAYGGKGVENRGETFRYRYRGPLAIHAGVRDSARGHRDPRIIRALATVDDTHGLAYDYGAIIALADLTEIHDADDCCAPWGETQYVRGDGKVIGCRHLVLENVRALEMPIRCRGFQGLWWPATEVQEQLRAAA